VPKDHKRHLLTHLIQEGGWPQALVFTRTKHGANRLAQQLEGAGIRAAAIHGNKSQAARVKALDLFKRGQVTALVATEVAARGLDIKELPYVVNYELPNVPEDYVHRIGRTGRAGALGQAVSLVSSDETGLLRDIERVLRRAVPFVETPAFKVTETAPQESRERRDARPHEQAASRSQNAGQRGQKSANRSQGSGQRSHAAGSRGQGSRGHGAGSRSHGTGSRGQGSRGHGTGSRNQGSWHQGRKQRAP
jgi:ATP-dependent RNA helicase RhlE